MALTVGRFARVTASGNTGRIVAANCHACKVLGQWFHADEVEEAAVSIDLRNVAGEDIATLAVPPETSVGEFVALVAEACPGKYVKNILFPDGIRDDHRVLDISSSPVTVIFGMLEFQKRWRTGYVDHTSVVVTGQLESRFHERHAHFVAQHPYYGNEHVAQTRSIQVRDNASDILKKLEPVIIHGEQKKHEPLSKADLDELRCLSSMLHYARECSYFDWFGEDQDEDMPPNHHGLLAYVSGHVIEVSCDHAW